METAEKEQLYESILAAIRVGLSIDHEEALIYKFVVDQLSKMPYFDWTGIYLLNPVKQELYLYYYVGKPTEHIIIPVGKGVCGSAVAEHTDKIIEDVTQEENYLACSLETRSEIVVLLEKDREILGQIDIDSDEVRAFDETDRKYLRKIAKIIVEKVVKL
ncbi:MAG: GAF domain-containing protein [Candidatus Heimdallarchaeota archaeon]